MRVLAEYEVLGDDKYSYIEPFEYKYSEKLTMKMVKEYARRRICNELLQRGVLCNKLEVIC